MVKDKKSEWDYKKYRELTDNLHFLEDKSAELYRQGVRIRSERTEIGKKIIYHRNEIRILMGKPRLNYDETR